MSDSVRPHRRQPTRLLCPWNSPGKTPGKWVAISFSKESSSWLKFLSLALKQALTATWWQHQALPAGAAVFPVADCWQPSPHVLALSFNNRTLRSPHCCLRTGRASTLGNQCLLSWDAIYYGNKLEPFKVLQLVIHFGKPPQSSPPPDTQLAAVQSPWFDSWVGKICWRRDRLPTPVFLGFPCGSAGKESPARREGSSGWETRVYLWWIHVDIWQNQ